MPAPTAEALAEALGPLIAAPGRAAVFCDIDGTLAPIVQRAQDAKVPQRTSQLLGRIAKRYGCVACISGRPAAEARRLVGVGGLTYAGTHGAELLRPGGSRPEVAPELSDWSGRVRDFARERDGGQLRRLRVRIEDKGPIVAFHWRGAPDEDSAHARVEELAREAESEGFATHWGRKVLEVRPPVPISKGKAVLDLVHGSGVEAALFGGDDATDLDAWDALDQLLEDGSLKSAVRVGVRSDESPEPIVARADLVVDGVPGYQDVLATLAEA